VIFSLNEASYTVTLIRKLTELVIIQTIPISHLEHYIKLSNIMSIP
jgi:hypothetical protein